MQNEDKKNIFQSSNFSYYTTICQRVRINCKTNHILFNYNHKLKGKTYLRETI